MNFNLFAELLELYDRNEQIAGLYPKDGGQVLLPVYHAAMSADVTVCIDADGKFLGAKQVDKTDGSAYTVISVTETSHCRSSGISPHGLCDGLKYLAEDYGEAADDPEAPAYHRAYMENLKDWIDSPHTHPKAEAVYKYLSTAGMMSDLLGAGALERQDDGTVKKAALAYKVRFRVEEGTGDDPETGQCCDCWKDRSLHKKWQDYIRSQPRQMGLSMISGTVQPLTTMHPKFLLSAGDMGKLFSNGIANEPTVMGRLLSAENAYSIGFEDSQKVANALRWLVSRNAVRAKDMVLIIWGDNGAAVPRLTDAHMEEEETEEEKEARAERRYVERFRAALAGYRLPADMPENMHILVLQDPIKGRTSVRFYGQLATSEYLRRIKSWQSRCGWIHTRYDAKTEKMYEYYGIPSVYDMAKLLYGKPVQQGENVILSLEWNEEMYARLILCVMSAVLDGTRMAPDIVKQAVRRASNPAGAGSESNWRRMVSLACSLVKEDRAARGKEVPVLKLDKENRDRSYLYGRLLAVADKAEELYYIKNPSRKRPTNAKKLMAKFSQSPAKTWMLLHNKLQPYLKRLGGEARYYENAIMNITGLFREGDFEKIGPLEDIYLCGFYSQESYFDFVRGPKKKDKEAGGTETDGAETDGTEPEAAEPEGTGEERVSA